MATSSARSGSRTTSPTAARIALDGDTQAIDLGRVTLPRLGRPRGAGRLRERGERGHERSDRAAGERHVEGARRQGVVPVGDVRRLRRLVGGRDAPDGRRREPQREDVRRRGRERQVLRRRHEDVPRRAAGRRAPGRGHDRRRDEARSRADDAEDLPRHAPAAPEGRGPSRARRHGRDGRAGAGRARRRAARNDTGAVRGSPGRAAAARSRRQSA